MTHSLRIDRAKIDKLMKGQRFDTYEALAQRAGVHPNTITNALHGKPFNSKTAAKLAIALSCSPFDIQTAEGFDTCTPIPQPQPTPPPVPYHINRYRRHNRYRPYYR